jgi:hypothetical protein
VYARNRLQDDGSFRLLEGDTASRVPDGWREDTAQPGLFQPPWSSCRYRRLSANAFDGRITITPHCLRHLTSCTVDQCVACTEREADLAQVKTVPVTNAAGEETGTEMVRVSQQPFLSPLVVGTEENLRGKMWAVEHATQPAATARISPLTNIEATLPPHKEGRDRPMHFEPDGAIVYTKTADRDEPPKDINGYKRDPNNACDSFHFGFHAYCDIRRVCVSPPAAALTSSCDVTIQTPSNSATR